MNYTYASHLTTEKHHFEYQKDKGTGINTTYIILDHNKYDSNHWFRIFLNNNDRSVIFKSEVTYVFADGLLGFRVLKASKITG